MHNNYIIAEIKIKEEDINKDIRIIKSFEQYKREYYWRNYENDNNNEKEKEIKEKCENIINEKKISFNYFHKFKKEGKYEIKYIFKENIINAKDMFS